MNDDDLSPEQMRRLRSVRERELDRNGPHTSPPPGTPEFHFFKCRPCQHCGDFAVTMDHEYGFCCKECWLELTQGVIPSAELMSNAPRKPDGFTIKSRQQPPGTRSEDYFGDHDEWADREP